MTGLYSSGTQTAQALALWVGAVPKGRIESTVQALATDVMTRGITFGFLGVQYVFETLARFNRTDAALYCLLQSNSGYGHQIYNMYEPSTSLWESWNGDTMHQWLAESSRSHHYQASISTFFRKHIAGLDMVEGSCGWKHIRVRSKAIDLPLHLARQIPAVAASVKTHRGIVSVSWKRMYVRESAVYAGVDMNISIPSTSQADVFIPKIFGNQTKIWSDHTLLWTTEALFEHETLNGKSYIMMHDENFAILRLKGDSMNLQIRS